MSLDVVAVSLMRLQHLIVNIHKGQGEESESRYLPAQCAGKYLLSPISIVGEGKEGGCEER
jgi:hypothetical protein